ncbi:MAG TPA: hypothetical protein VMR97_04045 [Acidimicrobiales bacterium]|nr:hypothetical protein [Acidimicrobiales bacterium]
MDRLLGTLVTRAFRRGLRGEPLWLAVAAGAWLVRRARQQPAQPVWSGRIGPGDRLVIEATNPMVRSEIATNEG